MRGLFAVQVWLNRGHVEVILGYAWPVFRINTFDEENNSILYFRYALARYEYSYRHNEYLGTKKWIGCGGVKAHG